MFEKVLFLFSMLGVCNAFLLAVYLFLAKSTSSLQNRLISFLLLILVVRVGISCFHFFETVPAEAIKLGLAANLLIGPVLFHLFKAAKEKPGEVRDHLLYHVNLWLLLLTASWFQFDFYTWNWIIRYVVHFVLTSYLVSTFYFWRADIKSFLLAGEGSVQVKKAVLVYLGVLITCMGFAVSLFTSYIVGPLVFTFTFYASVPYFMLRKKAGKSPQKMNEMDVAAWSQLDSSLSKMMEEDKLYREPNLSLDTLAQKLGVSRHLLSQFLNDYLKSNFYTFINQYRIEEACLLLQENKFSVEAIAYEVGFNSRSSFFTSFKKLKGTTPSKYRATLKSV